jgi:hypothetical protein
LAQADGAERGDRRAPEQPRQRPGDTHDASVHAAELDQIEQAQHDDEGEDDDNGFHGTVSSSGPRLAAARRLGKRRSGGLGKASLQWICAEVDA